MRLKGRYLLKIFGIKNKILNLTGGRNVKNNFCNFAM